MSEKVLELLNKAVADELSAVHQYMYFHFHCDDMGYDLLAALFRKTAIEEMMHVEVLAERILFLGGDVEMVLAEKVQKIHDVAGMLARARDMEAESAQAYNIWANECAEHNDAISRHIFEDLIAKEERHFDQFDVELQHLKQFGDQYLALQSIERSKDVAGE